MATGNLMKWREYLQKQRREKEEKKIKRESDGEACEPESERGRKRREGRISLGGKLVALWGFLLEFNLSAAGEGRRGGRGEREDREQPGSAAVWNMCRLDV